MKKVGVIGCGRIAQRFHIKNLIQAENAELVALCDEREEIAQEIASKYLIKKVYKNYKELLSDESVEAVIISTPPESHFQIMKDAAEAKKHIFVEKPLANTIEECKKIVEICETNKVKLMVGFMRRFDKALIWSKEKINSGETGKVFVINSTYNLVTTYGEYLKITDTEIIGKGTMSQGYKENLHAFLINNLIHHADSIRWIGGSVERLLASSVFESDHFTLNVILKYINGTTGHLQFNGFIRTEWHETIVIHGTKGSIFIDMYFPYLTEPSNGVLISSERNQRVSPLIVANTMYKDELEHFLNCIEKNIEPESNGYQALEAQRIVDAIEKSLRQETWVKIN